MSSGLSSSQPQHGHFLPSPTGHSQIGQVSLDFIGLSSLGSIWDSAALEAAVSLLKVDGQVQARGDLLLDAAVADLDQLKIRAQALLRRPEDAPSTPASLPTGSARSRHPGSASRETQTSSVTAYSTTDKGPRLRFGREPGYKALGQTGRSSPY